MRNLAKCNLCKDIIESYHPLDYVSCGCGEIALDGGIALKMYAKTDLTNIIRINEDGTEVQVKVIEPPQQDDGSKSLCGGSIGISKDELTGQVSAMIAAYENLPPHALNAPATNYDLLSVLLLLSATLRVS